MTDLTKKIELRVAKYFKWRYNLIVPNVWWGLGFNHECDLLILTKSNYAYEVEIKISKADLKLDLEKKHKHYSKYLKKLYFAIPEKLLDCVDLIPEQAGILVFKSGRHRIIKLREAKVMLSLKFTDKMRNKLYHLAAMRIWGLKQKLLKG